MATNQPTPARQNIKRRCMAGDKNPNYRGGFASKCARCDTPVWVKPSRATRPRHFCSKACCNRWMAESTTALDHWRYQGGDVERTCGECRQQYFQTRKEFNRNPGRFCSRKCSDAGRRRRRQLTCEVCLTDFAPKAHKADARFCSRPCKRLSQIKTRSPEEIARKRTHMRMSSLMWHALKNKKAGRSWVQLTGNDAAALMKHLESQLLAGMSWENMGEWHIDHIRPISSFTFTDVSDPEFRECWALTNLRPLWKLDNLSKGSRWSPEDVEEARASMTPAGSPSPSDT